MFPGDAALPGVDQSYGRIEARAGHRSEGQDQGDERRAGGERVGEQRDRDVAPGKALAHDSGANDGGEKKGRAYGFGGKPADESRTIRHSRKVRSTTWVL